MRGLEGKKPKRNHMNVKRKLCQDQTEITWIFNGNDAIHRKRSCKKDWYMENIWKILHSIAMHSIKCTLIFACTSANACRHIWQIRTNFGDIWLNIVKFGDKTLLLIGPFEKFSVKFFIKLVFFNHSKNYYYCGNLGKENITFVYEIRR